jgi:hypothetical protein
MVKSTSATRARTRAPETVNSPPGAMRTDPWCTTQISGALICVTTPPVQLSLMVVSKMRTSSTTKSGSDPGASHTLGRYWGSMYAQCAAGDVLHSSRHASWLSGNPSCPQRSSASVLHAAASGTHWLHRFASALQPGIPQSCVMVPSPVALHMRAPFASHAMNSFVVQLKLAGRSGVVSVAASVAGDGTFAGRGKSQAVRKTNTQTCLALAFTRRLSCARPPQR